MVYSVMMAYRKSGPATIQQANYTRSHTSIAALGKARGRGGGGGVGGVG